MQIHKHQGCWLQRQNVSSALKCSLCRWRCAARYKVCKQLTKLSKTTIFWLMILNTLKSLINEQGGLLLGITPIRDFRVQRHLQRLHFKAELTQNDFEANNHDQHETFFAFRLITEKFSKSNITWFKSGSQFLNQDLLVTKIF